MYSNSADKNKKKNNQNLIRIKEEEIHQSGITLWPHAQGWMSYLEIGEGGDNKEDGAIILFIKNCITH